MIIPVLMIVVIIGCVSGRFLPPLPMKDGCYWISPEVDIFRVQGDAVIITFPKFKRVLQMRNLTSLTAKFLVTKGNVLDRASTEVDGRVQQHDGQLWLLPSLTLDSGEYTCVYRNKTYCAAGRITLHVYESSSVAAEKLSYSVSTRSGQPLQVKCPSISHFNSTGHIEWYKEPNRTALYSGSELWIPHVKRSHQGLYTCLLKVLLNNKHYNVSRTIEFSVQDSPTSRITMESSISPDLNLISTVITPIIFPPMIIYPLNGSIFETAHGSGLELVCKVLTHCLSADSTVVTWLAPGQLVESSYLGSQALQGTKRVSKVPGGCQVELRLVVTALADEDSRTDLTCVTQNQEGQQQITVHFQLEDTTFTWLVVAVVILSTFLTIISIFYFLLKPKTKTEYVLARQSSVFTDYSID